MEAEWVFLLAFVIAAGVTMPIAMAYPWVRSVEILDDGSALVTFAVFRQRRYFKGMFDWHEISTGKTSNITLTIACNNALQAHKWRAKHG